MGAMNQTSNKTVTTAGSDSDTRKHSSKRASNNRFEVLLDLDNGDNSDKTLASQQMNEGTSDMSLQSQGEEHTEDSSKQQCN